MEGFCGYNFWVGMYKWVGSELGCILRVVVGLVFVIVVYVIVIVLYYSIGFG